MPKALSAKWLLTQSIDLAGLENLLGWPVNGFLNSLLVNTGPMREEGENSLSSKDSGVRDGLQPCITSCSGPY